MLFSDKVCFLAINDKSRKVMNSSITTALLQCYLDSDNESEDINEEKVAQTELWVKEHGIRNSLLYHERTVKQK